MISEKVETYRRLMNAMLDARLIGDDDTENRLMDKMDTVWFSMSAEELEEAKRITSERTSNG